MKYIGISLVVLCLALATPALGQELLTNPGFETGDTTGWTVCGGTMNPAFNPNPHGGSNEYGVVGCCASWGSPAGAIQTVGVVGTNYDVVVWTRACDTATSDAGVGSAGCGSPPTTILATDSSTCTWTQGTTTVGGPVDVVWYAPAHAAWDASSGHFDDASVQAAAVEDWYLY